ncbi:hypothetical protein D3C78_1491390 [compost metagenome]
MPFAVHQDAGDADRLLMVLDLEGDREAMPLHDRLDDSGDVVQRGVGVAGVQIHRRFEHGRDLALHLRHAGVEGGFCCLCLHALMHGQKALHLLDVAGWVGGCSADHRHDAVVDGAGRSHCLATLFGHNDCAGHGLCLSK